MLNDLKSISEFDRLAKIIQNNNNLSILNETDAALAAWQVIKTYQQDHANFKKAIKYLAYLEEKESYGKIIHDFNSSWNEIKPKETKGSLVVEFPKAHYLSNGQRDILTFVLLLEKAKRKLKKSQCILIIDEIFDYLDEANLVAFQYYVTKMIDEFKSNNKYLYPLLLTHLNPNYFNHFCFSRHKLHVHFLDKRIYNDLSHLLTLIKKRNDPSIKDAVSQHHFHYNPVESDLEQQFANIGIRKEYAKSTSFYNFVHSEARKYISGTQSYDQLAVCFSVRIKIEEKIYSLLADEPHKNDFINKQRGTANKLNFASSIGVSVPETFFFLGLIYNDNLHQSSDNPNIVSALIVQLENITIKKIIKSVY